MVNKWTYKPPCDCDTLFKLYVIENKTQVEIAKLLGTSQHVIWKALKNFEIPTRIAAKRDQIGEKNSFWKGGRFLNSSKGKGTKSYFSDNGYYYIKMPDHPNARKNGYVAEHTFTATEMRGSPLLKNECVHHIDMNKQNNNADNLVICDRSIHRRFHMQLEKIAIDLYKSGIVSFDKNSLEYKLKEVLC